MSESPKTLAVQPQSLTTDEFAYGIHVQPETVRKRYSQTGSYFDIRPRKLKNRRLAWPADAIERFTQG